MNTIMKVLLVRFSLGNCSRIVGFYCLDLAGGKTVTMFLLQSVILDHQDLPVFLVSG